VKLHILKRNRKAFEAWAAPHHFYIVFIIQISECAQVILGFQYILKKKDKTFLLWIQNSTLVEV